MVRSGFVMAWRFATWPTILSPVLENATTEGVVRAPSALGDDDRLAAFNHGHAGICCTKVNADCLCHSVFPPNDSGARCTGPDMCCF